MVKNRRDDERQDDKKRIKLDKEAFQLSPECTECPVCRETLLPPVFMCREGHLLCNDCRGQIKVCPVCKRGPIDVRCRPLENVLEHIEPRPCCHHVAGCSEVIELTSLRRHEKTCQFRPIPCDLCNFSGYKEHLVKHYEAHNYFWTKEVRSVGHIVGERDVPAHYWLYQIIQFDNNYFQLEFLDMPQSDDRTAVYLRIVIFGPSNPRYRCTISITTDDEDLCSEGVSLMMEYKGCRIPSIHEEFSTNSKSHKGNAAALPRALLPIGSHFTIKAKVYLAESTSSPPSDKTCENDGTNDECMPVSLIVAEDPKSEE